MTARAITSRAALRRLWADPRPLQAIAADLKMSVSNLSMHAKRAGLEKRRGGQRPKIKCPDFARMWLDGVRTKDLVALYDTDHLGPARHAKRLGLPPRGRGWIPRMTLAEWREQQIAMRWKALAKAEEQALRLSEMKDSPSTAWGKKQATTNRAGTASDGVPR